MNSLLGLLVGQLPRAITPTIAGLTVGAVVGVIGFLAVMLLVGRGQRRPIERPQPRAQVVPQYASFQRVTPLPPNAFTHMPSPQIRIAPLPFTPSTALSARALAKVYGGEESAAYMALPADQAEAFLPPVILPFGLSQQPPELPPPPPSEPAPESIPISVSPIVMVQDPHPLGIIPTGSSVMEAAPSSVKRPSKPPPPTPASAVMRAARFDDFDVDEGATEIAETVFDEPPKRPSRSEPPKIRPVSPSGPRFPAAPRVANVALPTPTPPKARVATRHHS